MPVAAGRVAVAQAPLPPSQRRKTVCVVQIVTLSAIVAPVIRPAQVAAAVTLRAALRGRSPWTSCGSRGGTRQRGSPPLTAALSTTRSAQRRDQRARLVKEMRRPTNPTAAARTPRLRATAAE
jgi:hypothetical protein